MLEVGSGSKRRAVDSPSRETKFARHESQDEANSEEEARLALHEATRSGFVDASEDSPDEAAEALLNLQSSLRSARELPESQPGSQRCRQRTSRWSKAGLGLKAQQEEDEEAHEAPLKARRGCGGTSPTKSRGDLPKRCSCGKHISKDHPLCKSNVKELLERFLDRYCRKAPKGSVVDLQQAEIEFDVALRRLYDILVVLEAAQVLLRVSSKKYEVLGMNDMDILLAWLDKYQEQRAQTVRNGAKDEKIIGREQGGSYDLSCMLMIHLRRAKKPVLLSDAAEVLKSLSPRAKACKKTIERRIYDISSVLETLNLISRSYHPPNKQPSFEWNREYVQAHLGVNKRSSAHAVKGTGLSTALSQDTKPSLSSAFSNWAPISIQDGRESSEEFCTKFSSDQTSDWSCETVFRRPSPPSAWTAPMSSLAPLTEFQGSPSISSTRTLLSLPSKQMSSFANALESPCSMGGFAALAPSSYSFPDHSSSLSIPPLDVPALDPSQYLPISRKVYLSDLAF